MIRMAPSPPTESASSGGTSSMTVNVTGLVIACSRAISSAHRESVHRRIVPRWIVTLSDHILAKHATQGVENGDFSSPNGDSGVQHDLVGLRGAESNRSWHRKLSHITVRSMLLASGQL